MHVVCVDRAKIFTPNTFLIIKEYIDKNLQLLLKRYSAWEKIYVFIWDFNPIPFVYWHFYARFLANRNKTLNKEYV